MIMWCWRKDWCWNFNSFKPYSWGNVCIKWPLFGPNIARCDGCGGARDGGRAVGSLRRSANLPNSGGRGRLSNAPVGQMLHFGPQAHLLASGLLAFVSSRVLYVPLHVLLKPITVNHFNVIIFTAIRAFLPAFCRTNDPILDRNNLAMLIILDKAVAIGIFDGVGSPAYRLFGNPNDLLGQCVSRLNGLRGDVVASFVIGSDLRDVIASLDVTNGFCVVSVLSANLVNWSLGGGLSSFSCIFACTIFDGACWVYGFQLAQKWRVLYSECYLRSFTYLDLK